MRTALFACLLAPLALLAPAAQAQNMKPGLWEIRQTPELDPQRQAQLEQAQKQLAALSPEQRKMMEQMMAQRGVNMDLSGGTITLKACVSEEQAKRNQPPVDGKGKCSHQVKREGNVIRTHFSCSEPESVGDSEVTLNGDSGYTTKSTVSQRREGKLETIRSTGEGRWLGSDCGALKPMNDGK